MPLAVTGDESGNVMHSCQCGICGHRDSRDECIKKECVCCLNFHIRSGPRT